MKHQETTSEDVKQPDYITGDVASGLERLRKRLLDLSKFNRLLNFRYYTRSTLRVVDELPDQLFENLMNGKTFIFDPIPTAKSYKDKLAFFEAHPEQLDTPDQLEKIKNPKDIPTPKVEAYAKWKGIRANFELPLPENGQNDGRHQDTKIQTLLYPKDLEAVAARLASLSRTAIEETGSNMLFLSFGFLEWTEDDSSDKTYIAPLLLLPTHLERQKKSRDGMFKYAINYSGEDLQANLSLQEKLKEFGLDLPDIDPDGELPEAYFSRVQKVIRNKLDWRIKRHVSLSILQFGKQLLYLDLDPERWPEHKKLTDHDLVSKFFLGGDAAGLDFAQEYDIDELEGDVADLPLITEADSSQHSAIVDALAGRSFVVEGPPGTGKSQTITNMIGCALSNGKKVLFVAEKLAALEVVRRRLNQAGLGDFTLELHSNKTQKRALLDDIETRLKKHGQYRAPPEIDRTLQELHKKRESLKNHAGFMHDIISDLEQSPYQLLHKAARHEREVVEVCPEIERLVQDRDEPFSVDQYIERIDTINTMLRSLSEIKDSCGSLRKSPWFGVNKNDLRARDKNEIIGQFEGILGKLAECKTHVSDLYNLTGQPFNHKSSTYSYLLTLKGTIESLPSTPIWSPVKHLKDAICRENLSEFGSKVTAFHVAMEEFKSVFESDLAPQHNHETQIESELNEIKFVLSAASNLSDLRIGLQTISKIDEDIECTQQEWLNVLDSLQADTTISVEAIGLASNAVRLSAEAPLNQLKYRTDVFDEDIDDILESINVKLTDLLTRREQIEAHFSGHLDISINDLKSAANVLENESLSRVFSPSWWKVRSLYLRLCNNVEPDEGRNRTEWLRFVARYMEDKLEFEKHSEFNDTLNDLFKGLDTDIQGLKSLRGWYSKIRNIFGNGFSNSAQFGNKLVSLDSSLIKSIGQLEKMGIRDKGTAITNAMAWLDQHLEQEFDNSDDLTAQTSLASSNLQSGVSAIEKLPIKLLHLNLTVQECMDKLAHGTNARTLQLEIDNEEKIKNILGEHCNGVETNTLELTQALKFAEAVESTDTLTSIKDAIFGSETEEIIEDLIRWHDRSSEALDQYFNASATIITNYNLVESVWFGTEANDRDFDHFKAKTTAAIENQNLLSDWISYMQNKRTVCDIGLADLVELIELEKLPEDQALNALAYLTYFPHADELASQDEYLAEVNGDMLDELRSSFVRLDEKIQELNKQGIAAVLDTNRVPQGIPGPKVKDKTELSLIMNEVNKKTRHVPIRQLVKRAGNALLALKPCWMMGPLSVAQYLEAGKLEFDLVIMDEASQMRPEDAIGCIARSKQVIVVGDPKQLPPTSFFSKNVEFEEDDDELAGVEESESILDAANTIFRPARRLRWHYRSQCEDLIAFSNKNFYNDDLVVFPSPRRSSGINFEYVSKASCKKGRNPVEAHLVAQRAIEFMESGTSNSLGVVALNSAQQQLIEDEFYRLLKSSPMAETYLERRAQGAERFFIKNLENVQGDERDVIMISFTYGPDPDSGKVMNRFGPINSSAGWRRLNVLYTRAKKSIHVISSMHAEDIKLSPNAQLGPRVLKDFLAFAESGQLETGTNTGKDPDSDFEVAVATALKLRGYDCVAQLGVAGYFLDLVVKHPDVADGYIMGIECDGATYHSAKSVRDRDRLRQLVLERLGWNIERIWSTDWFEDSERQIDKICSRIEILRERDKLRREKQEAKQNAPAASEEHALRNQPTEQAEQPRSENDVKSQPPQKPLIAKGHISIEEARAKLIELRENVIHVDNPSADRSKGLLRNEMIEHLLATLPMDSEEFLKFTPAYMRGGAIDTDQYKKYAQVVFKILNEIED